MHASTRAVGAIDVACRHASSSTSPTRKSTSPPSIPSMTAGITDSTPTGARPHDRPGCWNTSLDRPTWRTRPSASTTIWSPTAMASVRSCVTSTAGMCSRSMQHAQTRGNSLASACRARRTARRAAAAAACAPARVPGPRAAPRRPRAGRDSGRRAHRVPGCRSARRSPAARLGRLVRHAVLDVAADGQVRKQRGILAHVADAALLRLHPAPAARVEPDRVAHLDAAAIGTARARRSRAARSTCRRQTARTRRGCRLRATRRRKSAATTTPLGEARVDVDLSTSAMRPTPISAAST